MGSWKAIALDSVRHAGIDAELRRTGLDWSKCAHIPATSSLARAIRPTGANAIAIATFIDLVVMDGLRGKSRVPVGSYPAHTEYLACLKSKDKEFRGYSKLVREWQSDVSGKRIWSTMAHQQHLRDYLEASGASPAVQRVFVESRQDYLKTVQTLIAAGIEPERLSHPAGLARIATDAWIDLERTFPDSKAVRDDLWMDLDEFAEGSSKEAVDLRQRILAALHQVFGPVSGTRTIVYHGFHFYTPPQWALFQLLRRMPEVDQVFVVHDDQSSSVYEVWRRFFVEKWSMPQPEARRTSIAPGPGVAAFRDALAGERVDVKSLGGLVAITSYRTPIEFVRHWKEHRSSAKRAGKHEPRTFAPVAEDVSRYLERFAGQSQVGKVNLGLLPLGAYLFALHSCIRPDGKGGIRFVLSSDGLVDIVGSGFLATRTGKAVDPTLAGPLRRALPFFADCRDAREWLERAEALHRLIISEVEPLGPRQGGVSDLQRITVAVENPLRLATWCDLTRDEAAALVVAVQAVIDVLSEIASTPKVPLAKYVDFLKSNLLRGMRNLPKEEKEKIEATVRGMDVGLEADVAADGLGDVVELLLGRRTNFGVTGEEEDERIVGEMRSLDEFGFRRTQSDLHLANLADGKFPGSVSAYGWPFRAEDIPKDAAIDGSAIEILETRAQTVALSDMYLFSLALDGVEEGHLVRLSYIVEELGEETNPSPILTLLTVPGHRPTEAIIRRAGGLSIDAAGRLKGAHAPVQQVLPKGPRASESLVSRASGAVDFQATASAEACPRRFALQWALGPTAAFTADHHQSMLYGNMLGLLLRKRRPETDARRTVNDLWRHLTIGQRRSSEAKAAIKRGKSAWSVWRLTLAGQARNSDPLSRALRAAHTPGNVVPPDVIAPSVRVFLPPAHTEKKHEVCGSCPVRSRCAVWFEPDE